MALEPPEASCVSWVPAHLLRLGANPVLSLGLDVPRGSIIEMVWGGDTPSVPQLAVGTLFPPPVDGLAVAGWRTQYFGGEDAQMLLG